MNSRKPGEVEHRNSLGYVIGGKSGQAMIVWGNRPDGSQVHISEATRGLHDELSCACGASLIARKGDVRAHHFAHAHGGGQSCKEAVREAATRFVSNSLLDYGAIELPLTYGRTGQAKVFATQRVLVGMIDAQLISAQQERELIVVPVFKRPDRQKLQQSASSLERSVMLVDLHQHRNSSDKSLALQLVRNARREWIKYNQPRPSRHLPPEDQHLGYRELRLKYLGRE